MNETPKPDVERIIAEIKAAKKSVEQAVPLDQREAVLLEDNLSRNLALANQHVAVGIVPRRSRNLLKRILYRILRDLIAELNTFHADVVHVLNKLVRILNGEDSSRSELLEAQQRRITMMEHLAERLAQYDRLHIEERLQALERTVFQNQ